MKKRESEQFSTPLSLLDFYGWVGKSYQVSFCPFSPSSATLFRLVTHSFRLIEHHFVALAFAMRHSDAHHLNAVCYTCSQLVCGFAMRFAHQYSVRVDYFHSTEIVVCRPHHHILAFLHYAYVAMHMVNRCANGIGFLYHESSQRCLGSCHCQGVAYSIICIGQIVVEHIFVGICSIFRFHLYTYTVAFT